MLAPSARTGGAGSSPREQGFSIALDDLGAGHSSLNRLVELRSDVAKLDMKLIRGIDQDPFRLALLKSLVRFGEEVGMVLVAEGIETPAELEAVRRQGVAFGQGYLLGRPRALVRPSLAPPVTAAARALSSRAPGACSGVSRPDHTVT